jgi:polyisoprenyl-phosphate glycosyltransferase
MPDTEIVILTPVYNDWDAFYQLLGHIDTALAALDQTTTAILVVVDDGSTETARDILVGGSFTSIRRVDILELVSNMGHQKAIAVGLSHVQKQYGLPVIVMDADGEDRPSDIARLLAEHARQPNTVVFARRSKRSEGWLFAALYQVYRRMFHWLTGHDISFGNFCLIPPSLLRRIVHLPAIWNHLAAALLLARTPWCAVPTERGVRYTGRSKMNIVALIMHGLSAISVFIEVAAVRMILFSVLAIFLGLIGFGALLYVRFFTPLAIPGWATTVATGLTIILFQSILFLFSLSFLVLSFRGNRVIIPARDYIDYILEIRTVYGS